VLSHAFIRHVPAKPVLALLGVILVAGVVVGSPSPPRRTDEGSGDEARLTSWAGRLSPGQMAGRALAIGLVALAVLAGRIGSNNQLRNIAPALVVGAGWPFLVLASTVIGGVWRWLDPWDGLARALGQDERDRDLREGPSAPPGVAVWPAVVPAMAWAWYLSAFRHALSPRAVGTALAGYSIVTVAGCLAFGRRQWLSRVEVFGFLFGWFARLPHRRLVSWIVPAGAEAVLGVVAGGLLFGAVRRSSLWGTLNVVPLADLYAAAGVVGASAAMAGLFVLLERWSGRLGAPGSVTSALVPALASMIVAVAMIRSLLSTSIQFLPILASDPFGRGWNLFGTADWAVPEPLSDGVVALVQATALVAGHFAGALVLTRRGPRSNRLPAALALCALLVAAAVALSLR